MKQSDHLLEEGTQLTEHGRWMKAAFWYSRTPVLKHIAKRLISMLMLAYAMLFIRFIRIHMKVCIEYFIIYIQPFFKCAYARKRVINRVPHDRKNTLFPSNPNSRAGLFGNL